MNLSHLDSTAGTIFTFLLLALASFRIQRIFTGDSWYPTQAWRGYLARKAEPGRAQQRQNFWTELAELFSCPWCFGFWVTVAVFCENHYLGVVPLWVYAIFAASGIVGFLGTYDE